MAPALPATFLVLSLLSQVAASSLSLSPLEGTRSFELRVGARRVQVVRIHPGRVTLLVFDGMRVESLILEGRERFEGVGLDEAARMLTLLPSDLLRSGERLRLRVRFQGEVLPREADFELEVHAEADEVVKVSRMLQSAESLRQELSAEKSRREQVEAEYARLRAACQRPEGLLGVVASELAVEGIQTRWFPGRVLEGVDASWVAEDIRTYSALKRVAVEVILKNPQGAASWHGEGAELTAPGGRSSRVVRVWQAEPIPGGGVGTVLVEAEAPSESSELEWQLMLSEAGGTRRILIPGIRFPDGAQTRPTSPSAVPETRSRGGSAGTPAQVPCCSTGR